MRRNVPGIFVVMTAGMLSLACSDKGQQREVDGMSLSVFSRPAVFEVGSNAEITATLQRNGKPAGDCSLRVRQYMPGMEMGADAAWHTMEPDRSAGKFRATTGEFSMGGDWELEFAIECGEVTRKAAFRYTLEWPE